MGSRLRKCPLSLGVHSHAHLSHVNFLEKPDTKLQHTSVSQSQIYGTSVWEIHSLEWSLFKLKFFAYFVAQHSAMSGVFLFVFVFFI